MTIRNLVESAFLEKLDESKVSAISKEIAETSIDEDFETMMFFRDDMNEELMAEETASEYRQKIARQQSHGPLMKANDWVKPAKIDKLADHEEINDGHGEHTLYVGHLKHPFKDQKQHVAILNHGAPDPDSISSGYKHSEKGYNKHHQWYEDTGNGHKFPSSTLVITGHVHRKSDGSKVESGNIDKDVKRTLMVYK